MQEERIDLFNYYRPDGKYSLATLFLLPATCINSRIISLDNLESIGFLNLYLYDKTENHREYYSNGVLLIFNPSLSFFNEKWSDFEILMETQHHFICHVYYDKYVRGMWFRINPSFGQDLRKLFKLGEYNKFPAPYINNYLPDYQRKVCKMDKQLRLKLERDLGLEEDELLNKNLCSKPDRESYEFVYIKMDSI